MSFVKEDGTLHLLRWKRKMSQPFLPLHCSVLYDQAGSNWNVRAVFLEAAVSAWTNNLRIVEG
jgi:hypothetical protein